ncbi:LysR substrate-binding domain-containing protein [Inquilinus sp. Marseille-Q2685]|uniref:LysR substrate-binding domain-containing protein n=1 Tax=Inquilinus sp. Marseille-Q2685 TaxID=2866581 RepID=UPI001CE3BA2B|nr:LysR substrate-binding domain-containing protein [Inquilinus sp. Marseille-Q2685]
MPKRLPALESLRVLEACARHANFTRAAAELGVTPAAVSLRIRDLEAELGVALFRRSGPSVTPTETGATLAKRMAKALGLIRSAVDDCRGAADGLRVTAVPTFAMRWLTPRLAAYHALPDAVPIRLDVSAELRPADGFDIAIRTGHGDWPGFEATALMPVDATPMLSPALAGRAKLSSPADLAALPLLPHDDWRRWFREAGVEAPALRFYADDYPTHELDAAAAIEGAGVALLSPRLFGALLRDGKLVQPFPHVIRGPAAHHILLRPGEARRAALRFRDWLEDEARRPDAGPMPAA